MKSFFLLALLLMALHAVAPAQPSTSPEDLLKSGQAKLDKNDHEGALADCERAIRLRPDLAAAYFGRGRVLSKQGKSNAAVSDYSKALELDPNMTDALAARAELLLTSRMDFAGSIADYDKLINLGVGLELSYYQRGVAKARLRDLQGAIADYTTVLELTSRETPNYKPASYKGIAYSARGNARLALNDFDPAIADFTAAINLNARDGWNYLQRARAFDAKGEHESAQADYDKAIELAPHIAHLYGNRGIARFLSGRDEEAKRDFEQCLGLNPSVRPWLEGRIRWAERHRAAGRR